VLCVLCAEKGPIIVALVVAAGRIAGGHEKFPCWLSENVLLLCFLYNGVETRMRATERYLAVYSFFVTLAHQRRNNFGLRCGRGSR
jgi:hypothetical protein